MNRGNQQFTRIVVDSNQLNSARLREFLRASANNRAILTDYAWMEAYKANSIPVLKRSLAIVGEFADQTDHLWGTKKIVGLDFRGAALGDMLIRKGARKDFQQTIAAVERLDENSPLPLSQLTPHVGEARRHIEGRLLEDMNLVQEAFPGMQMFFSDEEVAIIRRGERITKAIAQTIMHIVNETAYRLASGHPSKPRLYNSKSYFNAFLTRYAVAMVIYLLEWIRRGSQTNITINRTRNDLIDLNFAVYATYYNGILTNDRNLRRYHDELRVALSHLGARMPREVEV